MASEGQERPRTILFQIAFGVDVQPSVIDRCSLEHRNEPKNFVAKLCIWNSSQNRDIIPLRLVQNDLVGFGIVVSRIMADAIAQVSIHN